MPRISVAWLIAALVAGAAAVGITSIVITSDDGSGSPPPPHAVVVTLGGPGHVKVTLPPPAQAVAKAQATDLAKGNDTGAEASLKDTAPPAPAAERQAEAITPPGQPAVPDNVPQAAVTAPGCKTTLVRNYSSRHGSPVLLGVIHWTGSRPTLGSSAGALGIVRWFDTPAAQASSNYITDQDGRCYLAVPESQKAWTQAGFNPWSVSVEITNAGVQPLFSRAPGRAVVVRLMRAWHSHWGIPYRRAHVAGCTVIRSGFLAHRDLGSCGGGHPDVGSFDLDGLIREAGRGSSSSGPVIGRPHKAINVQRCGALRYQRAKVRHGSPSSHPIVAHGVKTTRGRRIRYLRGALRKAHVDEARYCR